MAANRGDTAGRGKDVGDLQRDDGGKGHKTQRSQEEIDKELDKSLENSPVLGPASHLATDEDQAGGRSQDKAVRRKSREGKKLGRRIALLVDELHRQELIPFGNQRRPVLRA